MIKESFLRQNLSKTVPSRDDPWKQWREDVEVEGNVINPDEIVESHGADALRVYEMFMGPLEAGLPWSTTGLDGTRKWLDRVDRLIREAAEISDENDHSLIKSTTRR